MSVDREVVHPGPAALAAPVQRVRGTNDFLPPEDAHLRRLESNLRAGFERYGYAGIQTPVLEPLDLFLRKSGDEILARIYSFVHWNRRLCLRPEMTASIMRAYVDGLQGHALPVRVHYAGPTFRYEKPQRGRFRQFTQVGVELIGAEGPAADAEVLHLAAAGLTGVGLSGYRLVVGHFGVVLELLAQLGLSEQAQGLILDRMEPLARGKISTAEAIDRVVELLGGGAGGHVDTSVDVLPETLSALPPDEAAIVASDILQRASLAIEGGVRSPDTVLRRLLGKARRKDPTSAIREAFAFVSALHQQAGPPERLDDVRQILVRRGLSPAPVDQVERALRTLRDYGADPAASVWEVDLSLARGLRYYTGLVFEVYADTPDGPLQVCGGGRYDDLVRALGGRSSVPACGFSFGLERVQMARGTGTSDEPPQRALVSALTPDDHPEALAIAALLRTLPSLRVEQDVRFRGPKAALRLADRAHAQLVVLVGERERRDGVTRLRDMRARSERDVPRAELITAVLEILGS